MNTDIKPIMGYYFSLWDYLFIFLVLLALFFFVGSLFKIFFHKCWRRSKKTQHRFFADEVQTWLKSIPSQSPFEFYSTWHRLFHLFLAERHHKHGLCGPWTNQLQDLDFKDPHTIEATLDRIESYLFGKKNILLDQKMDLENFLEWTK